MVGNVTEGVNEQQASAQLPRFAEDTFSAADLMLLLQAKAPMQSSTTRHP